MKVKWNGVLPIALMVVFALTRWPGLLPANFSAAYALAFCAGVYFPPRLAWWLPLGTLLGSDILLNLFYYHVPPLSVFQLGNYAAYAALIWLGRGLTARASWITLLGGGLLGAILFYFVTNTFSWLENPEYPKTLAGWLQALTVGTAGWPETWKFFRNTLTSGGLFTGLFAGAMKLSGASEPEDQPEPAEDEEAPEAEPAEPAAEETQP
ncbi:MAG: hypothetical protein KGS61_20540 [Verrucomicrobia bacterium]|nr:hypothetical protein [Verrucomicrobiota bacterium]